MTFQLTYRSEAIEGISMEHINTILQTSRKFNSAHNITGCLIFYKGFFVQLLEGNEEIVKALFDNIEGDKRHNNVDLLSQEQVEQRVFDGWDMAFLNPSEEVTNGKREALLGTLDELAKDEKTPNFTSKVFWYNVETLLSDRGFYQSRSRE
ncbi:BLUF domain-containing protein [Muriicola sp. Z0-33]|uniref:BLUF domain-containing protein n=1 Tax=Muriicola sp. Z0-33 TaxID=2816957 RepID=UPI0022375F22|nr:BLUF domain-containing protein [Muriicola sp. Z0-33]MCW5517745.1 BLUF domain-containing protein [Muriicola sp. Z0-33]